MENINKKILDEHNITSSEYKRILKILGREPNLLELGIFSVMWSEHCSYKSSRIHLKRLPTKAPHVIQGPGENAGVVDIGDGLAVALKMESHNHPSFIEPFQGAATGIGGILRDIFTMGARPIALLDSLKFGSLDAPRMKYLFEGVVSGISWYGNCIGVPTVGGETYFHPSYNRNILVNVMCVGIVKKERIFRGIARKPGSIVLYVGSKTGRDGIHGATMASDSFDEKSEERRPTVQVGDPFTEKLLLEASLEAMKTGAILAVQDMGAAGLTSSSCEMAGRGGCGVELELSLVPCREEGMTPYEIMLSESQERMLFIVEEGEEERVKEVFKKWDLDAVAIGRITSDKMLRVKLYGENIATIPIDALTKDAPTYRRPMKKPQRLEELQDVDISGIPEIKDYGDILYRLITSPNLSSKRWIYTQYDHMVGTNTVILPGSDAAFLRIKGTKKGIALTVDSNSRYCYLNPRRGAAHIVCEASRNIVCSGGKPLAITDCLNFGNPEDPEVMWEFRECIEGIREACIALKVPVVSGNVSFYNETSGVSIYPSPAIGMVGLIEDVGTCMNQFFRREGDLILLLGPMSGEIGGSEYLFLIHSIERGSVPEIDYRMEKAVQRTCLEGIRKGLIESAHDCSEGGLAVALAECCFGEEEMGAQVELNYEGRGDMLLFGEGSSRIIISVRDVNYHMIKRIAEKNRCPITPIGRVIRGFLRIKGYLEMEISPLKKVWERSLEDSLKGIYER